MSQRLSLPLMLAAILATGTGVVGAKTWSGTAHPMLEIQQKQAAGAEACLASEEVFASISAERALLARQQAALEEREAELELTRAQLAIEAERLAGIRDELQGLLDRSETAQGADLDRLVNLYRSMKPEEAAGILDGLDMETAVTILITMPERNAAPILAELDPGRARAVSRILLERSQLPGDQDLSDLQVR